MLDQPIVKLSYFVALLLLVIILVYYTMCYSKSKENMKDNQIYTAGATMRVIGQQFTSADQGVSDIVYNDEITNWNNYKENFAMPTIIAPSAALASPRSN